MRLPPEASIVIRCFRVVGIIGNSSIDSLVPAINRHIITVRIWVIWVTDKIFVWEVSPMCVNHVHDRKIFPRVAPFAAPSFASCGSGGAKEPQWSPEYRALARRPISPGLRRLQVRYEICAAMSSRVSSMTGGTSVSPIFSHRACAADIRSPAAARARFAFKPVRTSLFASSVMSVSSATFFSATLKTRQMRLAVSSNTIPAMTLASSFWPCFRYSAP